MFGDGHRTGPVPLPRSIPPFPGETTSSYLMRLANANRLKVTRLRILISGPGEHPIDTADLAVASGRSARSLRHALPELTPGFAGPRGRPALMSQRRPCRRCIARRGITEPVACWLPAEVTVCLAHHVWLSPPGCGSDAEQQQHDLAELPQLAHAQRRHHRLAHQYGRRIAAESITEAARITSSWTRRGHYPEQREQLARTLRGPHATGQLRRGDPLIPIVTYPETVALAGVLAKPQWRDPVVPYPHHGESALAIYRFNREVRQRVGIGNARFDGRPDPLVNWFYRRWRLAEEATVEQALRERARKTPTQVRSIASDSTRLERAARLTESDAPQVSATPVRHLR